MNPAVIAVAVAVVIIIRIVVFVMKKETQLITPKEKKTSCL